MMKPGAIMLIATVAVINCRGQGADKLRLTQHPLGYSPKNFYVNGIYDDRNQTAVVGTVNAGGRKHTVDLEKGLRASMGWYLTNLQHSSSSEPVAIHIKDWNINIKKHGSDWDMESHAKIAFYYNGSEMLEYTREETSTTDDANEYAEQFVRETLKRDLQEFDDWWSKNKGEIPTRKDAGIVVNIATTATDAGKIVYNPNRPLVYSNFEGSPHGNTGPEMASTMSGLGFRYLADVQNGKMIVTVTLTPYFVKKDSWFKEGGKNAALLAHEQLHFDITALKTCELAKKLRATATTRENYVDVINNMEQKNSNETNEEQDQYDNETHHGTIPDQQAAWERKIKEQLRQCGCY